MIERNLLLLMLDLYILAAALLTCLLELEISSPLIRDHAALPIEASLACLRLASGRGVLYCAAGLLAIDVSTQEPRQSKLSLQALSGVLMLLFGCANLVLGSAVAVKLKRLRRSLTGAAALSTAFHAACGEAGIGDERTPGLNAQGAARLFSSLGVSFGRYQMQVCGCACVCVCVCCSLRAACQPHPSHHPPSCAPSPSGGVPRD